MALPDDGERCTVDSSTQRNRTFAMLQMEAMKQEKMSTETPVDATKRYSVEELIEFQYKLLSTLLQRLVNQRASVKLGYDDTSHLKQRLPRSKSMLLDEVTDVVELEEVRFGLVQTDEHSDSSGTLELDEDVSSPLSKQVKDQLWQFVSRIASMYHSKNPFHSFEHACHVTFSAYQLLRRVVARDLPKSPVAGCSFSDPWGQLPFVAIDSTVGNVLASDILAQFAILFSALIHDVDHVGVPNIQLAKEKPAVAEKYQHRCLAEQTSVDLTWDLLEEDVFHDLKACIFPSRREYKRFRAMVVNMVMSTDISDTTLRAFQEQKWEKAFGSIPMDRTMEALPFDDRKRKATIMMDLIIMASDISHTMQPFEVYCAWNERLFREMYTAFREGRSDKDPSKTWCLGEMFFFDKHIIPLARRLHESGLFGPIADILLENAKCNRDLWQHHGQQIFDAMQERLQESTEGVQPKLENALLKTHDTTFWGSVISMCCLRPRPFYLESESEEEDDMELDDNNEGQLLTNKVHTNHGDDDTQTESDDDDDCLATSNTTKFSSSFGMGAPFLRSRAKRL